MLNSVRGILKKFRHLDAYRTAANLPPSKMPHSRQLTNEQRSQFKICIIDDTIFETGRLLRSYGYKFQEIGDLKSVHEVKEFDVVLCDLMGVGLNFDIKQQGATLIKEISKNYPTIIIAAYTASSGWSDQVILAQQYADKFIRKDADQDDWTQALDNLIGLAADPRVLWMRARRALIDQGVDTKEILMLEDAYVESILNNDAKMKLLESKKDAFGLSPVAQGIILKLISSAFLHYYTN